MNENQLFELLSNMDDDLIENEIDKLLEGVELDIDSINEKAHEKLKNVNKKNKRKKILPYAAVACLCFASITMTYADNISQALQSLFDKTSVYSTVVDGDAYYLKDSYALDHDVKLHSVLVSKDRIEMRLTGDLNDKDLETITILPKNDPKTLYSMSGYSKEKDQYFFTFMNKDENTMKIKPFKDFKLNIGKKAYDVSLIAASPIDLKEKIYESSSPIKDINIAVKSFEKNNKVNIEIIPSFKDKDLTLDVLGNPMLSKVTQTVENTKDSGIVGHSTSCKNEDIYAYDENNHKYKLNIPKDSKSFPVTLFETNAPKDTKLSLRLPALVASYPKQMDSFKLDIPKSGEIVLNKKLDFTMQKAVMEKITRTSENEALVEFKLNTGRNNHIDIREFGFYSKDVNKISSEFDGNEATILLEFDENLDSTDIEISYPSFVINGDWIFDLN